MSPLCELLGIDVPIIQAPMAGVQLAELAVAVANRGALGSLPGAMLDGAALRTELGRVRAGTRRAINVNFFCHVSPVPDPEREARWRARLAPYYAELGLAMPEGPQRGGRMPFDAGIAQIVVEERPEIVSFHFGLPAPELLARVKATGAKILSSATTVAEARWLAAHGVDAIIAQGLEAGGHRGSFLSEDISEQLGTFALVPQIVAAVGVPVVAAGGIADGAGVRAALALGAAGVQVGTAFLLCPEASTSAVHRAALRGATPTALTNVFSGRPARGIVNRLVRELGPMSVDAPAFPLASSALAALRAETERRGSGDMSPLWAGQNTSGCRAAPASEVIDALATGLARA